MTLSKGSLSIQTQKKLHSVFRDIEDHLRKVGADDVKYVSKAMWKQRVKKYRKYINIVQFLRISRNIKT